MCLDGFRAGSTGCTGFLSPFSPLTETNPLIKLSGIKLKSQLSKRSITILTHTLTKREKGGGGEGKTHLWAKLSAVTLVIVVAKK